MSSLQTATQTAELASLGVPAHHALIVSAILFVIGLVGVMARRNVLFMLMSLEIMMNSAALAFVVGVICGARQTGRLCLFLS